MFVPVISIMVKLLLMMNPVQEYLLAACYVGYLWERDLPARASLQSTATKTAKSAAAADSHLAHWAALAPSTHDDA
jgi:hypothetical protein